MFGLPSKATLIIGAVLGLALIGSGWYIKVLLEQKGELKATLAQATAQVESLSDSIEQQRLSYEATLENLKARDSRNRRIETDNDKLRKRLQEIINNENDECLTTAHSESISNLLRLPKNDVRGEANANTAP